MADPVFLNIRPRLAPGSSRPTAVSVHSSLSEAVCNWLLSGLHFDTFHHGYLDKPQSSEVPEYFLHWSAPEHTAC